MPPENKHNPDDGHNFIEEYQNTILNLRQDNDALTTERDTLSRDNETLRTENERLRNLNQTYFNRLIAQDEAETKKDPENEDPEIPTCEEFAKTIKF